VNRFARLALVSLLCSLAWAQSTVRSFSILHTNDLHAHLRPDADGRGGFAYLATELRHQRDGCTTCLYLNAGDLVQGTPVSTLFHGLPVYQIFNLLRPDVSTLGNHEFDYGWKNIQAFTKAAHFPIVSASVVSDDGHLLTGRGYVIRKLAVIGVLMGDLVGNLSTAEQVGPWKILPVVDAVRKEVAELKGRADLIVVLGHIHGEEADQILHQIPEVSIVIQGHEHAGYAQMKEFEHRYAVEGKSYGVELDRLDFQFDTVKHEVVSADWKRFPIDSHTIAAAPDVQKEVDKWEAKVAGIVDVPVGESSRRMEATELRQVIERAMAEETGADIAFINSGNVRDFLPAGKILARQVWNMLPFDNRIVIGTFKGSELPAAVTKEHPVDPGRTYKLAVTDFTAANQASAAELGTTGMKFPVTGPLQRDAVLDWIKKQGVLK
jgi:2',3'-cyclic-nucleotide 2'-phosphodiesterase (5'-nucleotidase family)